MSRTASAQNAGGGAAGFVLFGVLVGVNLVGIGLLVANTLWSRVLQREREAELLFRGEAVVRAIERFSETRPGTLPESLEQLVEEKYLRRAWLDPFTGRPFRLLRQEGGASPGGTGPGARPLPPPNPAEGDPTLLMERPGLTEALPTEAREEDPSEAAATPSGIIGVASESDLLSFRVYQGARRYSDWRFEATTGGGARPR